MTAKRGISRGWRLMACCAALFCTGGFYIWSVFSSALVTEYGWNMAEVTAGYSLMQIVAQLTSLCIGKPLDKIDSRITYLVGGILFGSGFIVAGFATSELMLVLAYSVIAGIGNGLLYMTANTVSAKWFPDKRGLASGVTLSGAGLSPLVLAPVSQAFIENMSPSASLKVVGVIFIVILLCCFWLMKKPEEGWTPPGWKAEKAAESAASDKTAGQMLREPLFYLMFVTYVCAATSGNMVMGHASNICQNLGGFNATQAATLVGVLSVASLVGRFGLATISDKIGRIKPLFFITIVTLIIGVIASQVTGWVVIVALLLIQVAFGGSNTVMKATTDEFWGSKNAGANWSIMYLAYTISAVVGPTLASQCLESTGSYATGFMISAGIAAVGVVALIIAVLIRKKQAVSVN